jgi:hypothetical protein
LETEKSLRDEQAKRKIAEDKLFNVMYQRSQQQAASAPSDGDSHHLLELANEELGKKELVLRDARRKSDIYEGQHLDKKSRPELLQAQKQLADVLKIIGQVLSNGSHADGSQ